MPAVHDDLGAEVILDARPERIVSLVPSLTESIAETQPGTLVGATDWCTHPADLRVTRVRGTKNPDLRAIRELEPDLVVANQEENRELDVRRLRDAGIPVWVTVTESVNEALASLRRLFTKALGTAVPPWLAEATETWDGDAPTPTLRAAIPIWRDPWMVVGRDTFTGDVLRQLGVTNVFDEAPGFDEGTKRYPHTSPEEILAAGPDVVLLPDEPYEFTAADGPEAFAGTRTVLLSGRLLTWYGPSLVTAHAELRTRLGLADT